MVKWRGFPSPSLVLRISRRAEHFTGYYQAQDGYCRWKSKGGHIEKKKRMREKRQEERKRSPVRRVEENGVSSFQGAGSLVEVVQHWAEGYNPILETFPASKLPLTVHRLYHHWRWASTCPPLFRCKGRWYPWFTSSQLKGAGHRAIHTLQKPHLFHHCAFTGS